MRALLRDALTSTISASTLERFREAAASGHPTPAGVAVAAVSASFAFGLLAKALTVSARRNAQSADLAKLEALTTRVRTESSSMIRLAADDITAFEGYLAGLRLPQASDRERLERRQALDSAIRQALDLPLAAARAAAAGLHLCAEAAPLTHLVVLADLGAGAALLAGALRAFLICAESNIRQLSMRNSPDRERLAEEAGRHRQALQLADEVLERVAAALAAAGASQGTDGPT